MSDVTASWKEDTKIRVIQMYFSSAVKWADMFYKQCIFLLSLQEEKVSTSSTSDELATGFRHMKIADESFLSPFT